MTTKFVLANEKTIERVQEIEEDALVGEVLSLPRNAVLGVRVSRSMETEAVYKTLKTASRVIKESLDRHDVCVMAVFDDEEPVILDAAAMGKLGWFRHEQTITEKAALDALGIHEKELPYVREALDRLRAPGRALLADVAGSYKIPTFDPTGRVGPAPDQLKLFDEGTTRSTD